ncbi:nucleotidyltransferase family protein [Methanococcus maripaludis]|uniref:protein adenylyltransferase n=2 Tax=Methanococcus maripaludis TaxID=39152 RepID=A0A8T3W4F0_METMI|nr:nucleotidyltransferase family protein [Methanococcus maripaludis]AEK19775.1 DNA polymerase subunit beta [Methanococcus maripaludis X1]MBG0768349.1 nucleotidyltransferase family protein [Methanococcus maripaludis]
MKTLFELKKIIHENRDALIKKYKVKTLGIFGSYVRNEQKETSDIDVLVEFQENSINFDNYMGLKYYLEDLFQKDVDLVIKDDLKVEIKNYILNEVEYAEGL